MASKFGKLVAGDFTATHTLCVYFDKEWGEYVAVVYYKCVGHSPSRPGIVVATYRYDNKEDTLATGRKMLEHATEYEVKEPQPAAFR